MKKCVICRSDILNEDPAVLFDSIEDNANEICSNCENQIDIMEGEDIKEAKAAVNYLYTCYLNSYDEKVKEILENLLELNSKDILDKEKEQASKSPVDTNKVVDYFSENKALKNSDVSNWISILNVTTLICVIILSIASLTLIITLGPVGIFVSFIYILGILLILSLIKIIINMSKEVSEIKEVLNKTKNFK